jgi:hypothetical protein
VVCGVPVPNPCTAAVDPNTASACVAGPACPAGVVGAAGPDDLVVVCSHPVGNPCPEEILSTGSGHLVSVCGQPVDDPCGAEVVGPAGPGQLATVCGQPVPNPLPGLVPECMDGEDNDHDGGTDYAPPGVSGDDAGCLTPFDDDESA